MTNTNENNGKQAKGPAFQWWMVSNLAIGAGFSAFVALLIPPYVTETTGSAADAGVVMAVMSLAAVLGPVLGGFADRYRAHRLVMSLGILSMALSFVAFGIAAISTSFFAIDAIFMGVGVAAVSAVAPVFVVGAGLNKALQAKRLTTYNLVAPIGQVLGGALLGAAAAAGWSYTHRFWLSGAVLFLALIVTWFSSKKPAQQVLDEMDANAAKADTQAKTDKPKSVGLGSVLLSAFGVFLLVQILSSITSNGINNQIANILPNVYGVDQATTSALISLAGLLNIAVFLFAGWWMGRSGVMSPFIVGHTARLVGALGLAVLGLMANSPLLLVAASMQILYQGMPFVRMTQPVGALRFSTLSAGQATGWVIGASAIGSFLGSVGGGILADKVGFNAINWMGAISAGIAAALTFIFLVPADRKKRKEEVRE